jgi:hypothetical protein
MKYATFAVGSASKDDVRQSHDGSSKLVRNWTMYVSPEALGQDKMTLDVWSDGCTRNPSIAREWMDDASNVATAVRTAFLRVFIKPFFGSLRLATS